MNPIRFCAAWLVYGIGDVISRPIQWNDWFFGPLYPIYRWCMCASVEIQGEGKGPWHTAEYPTEIQEGQ